MKDHNHCQLQEIGQCATFTWGLLNLLSSSSPESSFSRFTWWLKIRTTPKDFRVVTPQKLCCTMYGHFSSTSSSSSIEARLNISALPFMLYAHVKVIIMCSRYLTDHFRTNKYNKSIEVVVVWYLQSCALPKWRNRLCTYCCAGNSMYHTLGYSCSLSTST